MDDQTSTETSTKWHQRTLPRPTVWLLGEGFLYLATALTLPWWAYIAILLLMWAIAVVVILRSEWTIHFIWPTKAALSLLAAAVVWSLGSQSVRQAYTGNTPYMTATTSLAKPSVPKGYFPQPLSLRNLFDTDNFNSFNIAKDATITNPANGHHNVVTFKLFEDFNEKVEFLSVFIPRSLDAFDLCLAVGQKYKAVLDQFNQQIQAWTAIPGETAETGTPDLTFSGRIYVYLDDELSLQPLATLEKFYNQNGLSPEFRSDAFRTLHWHEQREVPQTSKPPSRVKGNG